VGKVTPRALHRYFPLIVLFWILIVLYPNPLTLVVSIDRILNLKVEPAAVREWLNDLPSEPDAIEEEVLAKIPYHYDWEVYGVPWYFPTVEEVLVKGKGDCKARALVLASILEARGIPYRISLSPIHMWVDYEGKQQTMLENEQVLFLQQDPKTGERKFCIPQIRVTEVVKSMQQSFWNPMPAGRKIALTLGLLVLTAVRIKGIRFHAGSS